MATITYGGDEVSALVFDIGSGSTRIGHSGEDSPKAVFPTWVGERPDNINNNKENVNVNSTNNETVRRKTNLIGDTEIYTTRSNLNTNLKNPVNDGGIIENWDVYEEIWEYSFSKLHTNSSNHPLLLTDPAWNSRENREKLIELAFEKFDIPAFYLGRTPVLSAFASGKSTALVFDSGATTTSAIPVVDGYILKKGIKKISIGGNFISYQAEKYLKRDDNIDIIPQYKIKSKSPVEPGNAAIYTEYENRINIDKQFDNLNKLRVLDDFKQTVCHVSETIFDERQLTQRPTKSYEFPNGYNNLFNINRFKIPEILFSPKDYIIRDNENDNTVNINYPNINEKLINVDNLIGSDELVLQSISTCDVDLRSQLYPNIVITGGNTLIPGFIDRLRNEISYKEPAMRTKIHATGQSYERKFSTWIGGSILSSLGTFHELWISKQEYDEFGSSGCEKRI